MGNQTETVFYECFFLHRIHVMWGLYKVYLNHPTTTITAYVLLVLRLKAIVIGIWEVLGTLTPNPYENPKPGIT